MPHTFKTLKRNFYPQFGGKHQIIIQAISDESGCGSGIKMDGVNKTIAAWPVWRTLHQLSFCSWMRRNSAQTRPRGLESEARSRCWCTAQIKDHGMGEGSPPSFPKLTVDRKMLCDLVRVFSQTSANADASDLTINQHRWIEALSRFSRFFWSDVVLKCLHSHSGWTL